MTQQVRPWLTKLPYTTCTLQCKQFSGSITVWYGWFTVLDIMPLVIIDQEQENFAKITLQKT